MSGASLLQENTEKGNTLDVSESINPDSTDRPGDGLVCKSGEAATTGQVDYEKYSLFGKRPFPEGPGLGSPPWVGERVTFAGCVLLRGLLRSLQPCFTQGLQG